MIVKKVAGRPGKGKVGSSIKGRIDYIRNPDDAKVSFSGSRNFLSDEPAAQIAEMQSLAGSAPRATNPVTHFVLSWQEGEQPSSEQAEEAVSIALDEFGMTDHQCVYAIHRDTDNIHLHLLVNRVHPETEKVIKINKGFDLEAGHRAIARIEHVQGWASEQNARYVVTESGQVEKARADNPERVKVSGRARDLEARTGEKSAQRIAQQDARDLIRNAGSWAALHAGLARFGMRYERKGSGAILWVGDTAVKASKVDRGATLAKLQKRLGEYQAAPAAEQSPRPAAPEPVKVDAPGWHEYSQKREKHYAERKRVKAALDEHFQSERTALAEQHRAERRELFSGNWKGKGDALNALRSITAAKQAAERAEQRDRYRHQREQWRGQYPPFPSFKVWLQDQGREDDAQEWRHRHSQPQGIEGPETVKPVPVDIRDYEPAARSGAVAYYRHGAGAGGVSAPAFVDHGKRISINTWRDESATFAALQLAAQKWGSFTVTGNDEYLALCARLAAEHGFKITNPELQNAIAEQREAIKKERKAAMQHQQTSDFQRYAEAVGADRYRVGCRRVFPGGKEKNFLLSGLGGWTAGELPRKIPEMLRLDQRGENVYYTPVSEGKHHIQVDDLDKDSLGRLIEDGYKPAVLLESSPGNFQAIITIPKLGGAYDREVGNRLVAILNDEYGDPRFRGAIHQHRAPGFRNLKAKHQRPDGSFPEVRLLKAERRECDKTLALSRQIAAEYEQAAAKRAAAAPQPAPGRSSDQQAPKAGIVAMDAYWAHYNDICDRVGNADLSRVDAMIAERLRVTGHSQIEVENLLLRNAPTIRGEDQQGRDWDDYAQRTARYAFQSPAAGRRVDELARYRQQWLALEGRDPGPNPSPSRGMEM